MKEDLHKECECDWNQIPLNERIGFQMFQVNSALRVRKNRDFEALDLTASQADILMYICGHDKTGNIQQVDIERQFHLSNPTVTGIIQRLESKGFLTREVSTEDKRCKFLHCTSQVKDIHDYIQGRRREVNELLTRGFSQEEKEELSRLLDIAIENLRRQNDTEN